MSSLPSQNNDAFWMKLALSLAETAAHQGEVPVGAIIVKENRIVGTGFNQREVKNCVIEHAEMIAIRESNRHLQSWRLNDCHLYVTLEPCIMCAGAIQQTRIKRVVYGTNDPKSGALGSLYQIHQDSRLNHRFEVVADVLPEESRLLLKAFFRKRRN
jgi:tRNA(adenine34) deaminase